MITMIMQIYDDEDGNNNDADGEDTYFYHWNQQQTPHQYPPLLMWQLTASADYVSMGWISVSVLPLLMPIHGKPLKHLYTLQVRRNTLTFHRRLNRIYKRNTVALSTGLNKLEISKSIILLCRPSHRYMGMCCTHNLPGMCYKDNFPDMSNTDSSTPDMHVTTLICAIKTVFWVSVKQTSSGTPTIQTASGTWAL